MFIILILIFLSAQSAFGANILYVSPLPSVSHSHWNRILAFGLVNKNHNVTWFGPDRGRPLKPENYTEILLDGIYEKILANKSEKYVDFNPTQTLAELQKFSVLICEAASTSSGLKQLLRYPDDFKFDLIVFEVTAGSCLYPLIHRFNYPPTVAVTAFPLPSYVAYNFGNQLNPAYVPWHSFSYNQNMNFVERLWNFVYSYGEAWYRNCKQYKQEYEIAKKIFGDDIPSVEKLERHMSLVLVNTDPVLDYPQPLAPNFIPIGGLHTRKVVNLPQDLKEMMDEAKNGAIIVSLGSNVRSDKVGENLQQELLKAFSEVPELVLWQFDKQFEDLPRNVVVRPWLPHYDLLGHRNAKLLIGNGGILTTQEAVYHGVPIISIPYYQDHKINTKNIVDRKFGVALDFDNISSKNLIKAIRQVIDNPKYVRNVEETSRRFKGQSKSPLKRAVSWVEYVLRHGDAHFLNTPARDLPFYVSSGLDIIAFLSLIGALVLVAICKLIKTILNKPKSKKKKTKTN